MKIMLMCNQGMSTSILVRKMREAAAKQGVDATIDACPYAEAAKKGQDASVILLGPQVAFAKDDVAKACPGVPVEAVPMQIYGRMDGAKVLQLALDKVQA